MFTEIIASGLTLAAILTLTGQYDPREKPSRQKLSQAREQLGITLCLAAAQINIIAASTREPAGSLIPIIDTMMPITMGISTLLLMTTTVVHAAGGIINDVRDRN